MMHSLRVFKSLLFVLVLSNTHAFATEICEENARLSPDVAFANLVKSHVDDNTLPPSIVEWLIGQPQVRNPVQSAKSIYNLSLRDAFTKIIRQMGDSHWPLTIQKLQGYKEAHSLQATKVDTAQTETRSVFSLIYRRNLRPADNPIEFFTASSGELFSLDIFPNHGGLNTYAYSTNQMHFVHERMDEKDSHDFYETQDGRVLFSIVNDDGITIIDVRTGAKILETNSFETSKPRHNFAPLLFEKNGRLKVALTRKKGTADPTLHLDYRLQIIDVEDKSISEVIVKDGKYRFDRLSNKQAFLFGTYSDPTDRTKRVALIYNLSTDKRETEFRYTDTRVWRPKLIEDHGPRLILFNSGAERARGYYLFNTANKTWEKFANPIKSKAEYFFKDKNKTPWLVRLIKQRVGLPRLEFQNLDDGSKNFYWEIPFQEGSKIWNFRTTETPFGQLFTMGETTGEATSGRVSEIHVYNFTTKESIKVAAPLLNEATGIGSPFYSFQEHRVLIPVFQHARHWHIYQLWGPDHQ